jgi:FKBP-type peptidyl-prolyl cis-trans isomerase/Bacterial Ig-like domain (group 3)
MNRRRRRPTSGHCFEVEALEGRIVLSAIGSASTLKQGAADVAAHTPKQAGTQTTLTASAGTLGQPITFTVTVRAAASAGSPTGTVTLTDQGQVIASFIPTTTSTSGKYAYSKASFTVTQPIGDVAYFFGKHPVTATFTPDGPFSKSMATKAFLVTKPAYTGIGGGVKIATIAPGSGPQIQAGQTANVLYTGYLASTGQVFDDSISHGDTPLSFTVGAGQVIPGFDNGTAGMQAGETRLIEIPPSAGYGATANGSIPANSTLIFEVTLQSISS